MKCSTCKLEKYILIPIKMNNDGIENLEVCIICFKDKVLGLKE